jgi:hypothetical protein
MILLGIGFTLAFASFNIQATAGVPDDEHGLAGGLLNTSLQVGGAIGLAVVTAVLVANGEGRTGPDALLAGFTPALIVITGSMARFFGWWLPTIEQQDVRTVHSPSPACSSPCPASWDGATAQR